jgi:hypothetical protein
VQTQAALTVTVLAASAPPPSATATPSPTATSTSAPLPTKLPADTGGNSDIDAGCYQHARCDTATPVPVTGTSASGVYLGVWQPGLPWNTSALTTFEQQTGKR